MKKILFVFVILLVLGGLFYFVKYNNGEKAEFESTESGKLEGVVTDVECFDSPKYYAVQKSKSPDVGSDILIKYKSSSGQNFPCEYVVANGDFEIKDVEAQYFLAFTDNFLVLDEGTAPPPRGLIVYDLRSRKVVFRDTYKKPVDVSGDTITYFSKAEEVPTLQNCPSLDDYKANFLGAVIMSKVTVNLANLDKKYLGVSECLATQ